MHAPKVLLHDAVRVLVRKRQHPAPRVLDQHDLVGAQQLLADDDAAKGIDGRCARLDETQSATRR